MTWLTTFYKSIFQKYNWNDCVWFPLSVSLSLFWRKPIWGDQTKENKIAAADSLSLWVGLDLAYGNDGRVSWVTCFSINKHEQLQHAATHATTWNKSLVCNGMQRYYFYNHSAVDRNPCSPMLGPSLCRSHKSLRLEPGLFPDFLIQLSTVMNTKDQNTLKHLPLLIWSTLGLQLKTILQKKKTQLGLLFHTPLIHSFHWFPGKDSSKSHRNWSKDMQSILTFPKSLYLEEGNQLF